MRVVRIDTAKKKVVLIAEVHRREVDRTCKQYIYSGSAMSTRLVLKALTREFVAA